MAVLGLSLVAAALVILLASPMINAFQVVPAFSRPAKQLNCNWSVSFTGNHHPPSMPRATSSALLSSSVSKDENPFASPQLDTDALTKYFLAAITELTLFGATLQLLDVAQASFDTQLPFPLVTFLFYASSIKSRVFNPLNNQRPDISKAIKGGSGDKASSAGFRDRVMPSWTPPGVIFPIMWLLIIGPIRAYTSAVVVTTTGSFLTIPIMAFILHLTVGDVWNTVNNTEKRYGASVIGVLCVVLSAINAAYQYSTINMMAGKLLGGTCLWLVIAAALITDTWRLNPTVNGDRVPLYPVKGEAGTTFMWGANNEKDE